MGLGEKGVSPVVGTILLVIITVVLSGTAGLTIHSMRSNNADQVHTSMKIEGISELKIEHLGGEPVPNAFTINDNGTIDNLNNLKIKVTEGTAEPVSYEGDNTSDYRPGEKIKIKGEWEEGDRIQVLYEPANQILIQKTVTSPSKVKLQGSITGTVTDNDGTAIEGAQIQVNGETASTDSNGDYTLEDISPGTYDVSASHDEYIDETHEVTVNEEEKVTENFSLETPLPNEDDVAFNDEDGDGVYDEGETTYTEDELVPSFDKDTVDLVIEKDIVTDTKIDIDSKSLTVRNGTKLSTKDNLIIDFDVGDFIDIEGAVLNSSKDIIIDSTKGEVGNIRSEDTIFQFNGKAEVYAGDGTFFVNNNGGTRADGGTYIIDTNGNAETLILKSGNLEGEPEKGTIDE